MVIRPERSKLTPGCVTNVIIVSTCTFIYLFQHVFAREAPSKKIAIWEIVVPIIIIADYESFVCLTNLQTIIIIGTPLEGGHMS